MFLGKIPTQPFSSGTSSTRNSRGSLLGLLFSRTVTIGHFLPKDAHFSHLGDTSVLSPTPFLSWKVLLVMFWFYLTRPKNSWVGAIEFSSCMLFFFFNFWWTWSCLKSSVLCSCSSFLAACIFLANSIESLVSQVCFLCSITNYLLDFSTLVLSFLFFMFTSLHTYSVLPSPSTQGLQPWIYLFVFGLFYICYLLLASTLASFSIIHVFIWIHECMSAGSHLNTWIHHSYSCIMFSFMYAFANVYVLKLLRYNSYTIKLTCFEVYILFLVYSQSYALIITF